MQESVCYSILMAVCMPQDELYSSRIRDFAVFGRQSHPRAEGPDYGSHLNASSWQLLGRFTAANTKGTQVQHSTPVFLLNACLVKVCPKLRCLLEIAQIPVKQKPVIRVLQGLQEHLNSCQVLLICSMQKSCMHKY